jgi:translation initiation factor IF-3
MDTINVALSKRVVRHWVWSDTIRVMVNVNEGIHAPTVRAVFPDGTVEVMPTATAIREAQAMGLDLVLIAPTR